MAANNTATSDRPTVAELETAYVNAIQERKRAQRFGGHAFVPWEKYSSQLAEARRHEDEALAALEDARAER